jgi:hypothetical protein
LTQAAQRGENPLRTPFSIREVVGQTNARNRFMAFSFKLLPRVALFHFKSKVRGQPVSKYVLSNPYHAVSISTPGLDNNPCRAAMACAGKRYLSSDAPRLPLPACDARTCKCRYEHHEDRRNAARRASDVVGQHSLRTWNGKEQRGRSGRRATDA